MEKEYEQVSEGSVTESNEPLLRESSEDSREWMHTRSKKRSNKAPYLLAVVILLLLLYNAVLLTVSLMRQTSTSKERTVYGDFYGEVPYSPANVALQYETRKVYDKSDISPWQGPPSDELDAAWEDLQTGVNIRVSKEEFEMQHENLTAKVEIADGGYIGVLGVWHQIHCLDILRRALHFDYYESRYEADKNQVYETWHYDHCIEHIRRGIMCHADTTLFSGEWVKDSHEPENKILHSDAESRCVNWDALDQWARGRALVRKQFKVKAGPFEKDHSHDDDHDMMDHDHSMMGHEHHEHHHTASHKEEDYDS